MENYDKTDWIRYPKCGDKTRTQVREHTILEDNDETFIIGADDNDFVRCTGGVSFGQHI